jgi:hypothetical protein
MPRVGKGRTFAATWGLVGLVAIGGTGCAAKQKIPIDCVPETVTVYVDGEKLDRVPAEIKLRSDRHHVLLFKGEGYRPEMIVLETSEKEGRPRLSPDALCVEPVFLGMERRLELEVEKEEP